MAKIEVTDNVNCDLDTVFSVFRDRLTELVAYLPDVEEIKVLNSEEVDKETVKMVNFWRANYDQVPKVARKFVKPDMLCWTDYATWHKDQYICKWIIEVDSFKEGVSCSGQTRYKAVGDNVTEVSISGTLNIDVKKIPGVPKIGASKTGPLVEKFMAPIISSNLTNVHRGLEKYMAEKG